jgi:hypothetical protein
MVALKDIGDKIRDFGCDIFIGREIFSEGFELFATLDLRSLGSHSYRSLEMACKELCAAVKEGKQVLLYQSPGEVGPRTRRAAPVFEALNLGLGETMKEGDGVMVVDKEPSKETYRLDGRRYEPFKPNQMAILQRMYQDKPEMKKFPNPFDAQPRTD